MATFNKFDSFVEALAEKKHDLGADTLVVALTNTAPVATNTQLSDLTEIAYTNLSSRTLTRTSSAQTSGVYRLIMEDLTLTASGGDAAEFRYVVIYNDTATNDELIGWYDNGSGVTIVDGASFDIDLDGVEGLLKLQ